MLTLPAPETVIEKMVRWGEATETVRTMLLTSSLARPDGPTDLLSDYDLILAVADLDSWLADERWVAHYGPPLIQWGDDDRLLGQKTYFRGVIYEDGVKIDFTLWPEVLPGLIAAAPELPDELDAGYRILLDKTGETAKWKAPSYRAYIPNPPTEADYLALADEFWWCATYVAKSLWRDELVFAKFCLDYDAKTVALRKMLEWRIEIGCGWSVRPGVLGRGLKRRLPPDLWAELAATYVGPETGANWDALFHTMALFRRVAKEVGDALGYDYPQAKDDRIMEWLEAVRRLPPPS